MSWRILLTALVVLSAVASTASARGSERLNVLLIVSDDMNTDLACYGHAEVKSPALDRLCRRGMRFDAAYCQSPLCNPSRVSFLSGLRPDATGVYTLFTPTRTYLSDAVMLPECFRRNGYRTVQVGKIFHTGEGFEDPPSWDVSHFETGKSPAFSEIIAGGSPPGPIKHTIDWAVLRTSDEEMPDGVVARQAAGYMREATAAGQPFFLGAGFRRPHAPFAAPKKYFDMYPAERTSLPPAVPDGYRESILPAALNHAWGPRPLTEEEQRQLRAAYFACSTFMDAQVGVLLDAMDELDLWKNTIVVFLGDHGYHLGDHGGLWHKSSLFEESCRVPLVVYAPGMEGGGRACSRLVELVDLYPTLAELCGLEAPSGLHGQALGPLLNEPEQSWKPAAFSLIVRTEDRTTNPETVEFLGRSVRTERWRYNEWDGGQRGAELYDRAADPGELTNLARDPAHAATVAELSRLLASEAEASAADRPKR